VNRRRFLLLAPVAAAGCSRGRSTPPTVVPAGVLGQYSARVTHQAGLVRVPADYRRTTSKPPHDLIQLFPELKGIARITTRLHPRASDTLPTPTSSHLGEPFAWQDCVPGPVAVVEALFPILQLRVEDAPPQFPFRPQTDLFQLFWNPRFRDQQPRTDVGVSAIWRDARTVNSAITNPELSGLVWPDYVPVPCRVAPERVLEFPSWEVLPAVMRAKLTAWKPDAEVIYRASLSVAPGTKAGGYWPTTTPTPPACRTCSWGMDYLLTVAEREWTDATVSRFRPIEESTDAAINHPGLSLGPAGAVHVFICRRCDDWPIAAVA
jgi:hypothetical protein